VVRLNQLNLRLVTVFDLPGAIDPPRQNYPLIIHSKHVFQLPEIVSATNMTIE